MQRRSRSKSPKTKKKMTKEELQLSMQKKKAYESKALKIFHQLIEPNVDPNWLVENLKDISKSHFEDSIEERAITKLCGYVLCNNPLTWEIKQKYHVSLTNKRVYDITKRKNFCSGACFGASNYLLEQMLTSPLWLRDKEDIPKFTILVNNGSNKSDNSGETIDIKLVDCLTKDDLEDYEDDSTLFEPHDVSRKSTKSEINTDKFDKVGDFVHETLKIIDFNNSEVINNTNIESKKSPASNSNLNVAEQCNSTAKTDIKNDSILKTKCKENENATVRDLEITADPESSEDEIIEQQSYFVEPFNNSTHFKSPVKEKEKDNNFDNQPNFTNKIDLYQENNESSDDEIIQNVYLVESNDTIASNHCANQGNHADASDKYNVTPEQTEKEIKNIQVVPKKNKIEIQEKYLENESKKKENKSRMKQSIFSKGRSSKNEQVSEPNATATSSSTIKSQSSCQKNLKEHKENQDTNLHLSARVEKSFQEWVSIETKNFLFGDDATKRKSIEMIERQEKYSLLCQRLNKLQFEDEEEDLNILDKSVLKPAPHFSVLKEEGQKLDIKVQAFYKGDMQFEEYQPVLPETSEVSETFVPLTEAHAPQALRRKIFFEKLDNVMPDLLRTLGGNTEASIRASLKYTSTKCSLIKVLVHTFALSSKNITFKAGEWTLIGLVIIKMISLLDPWLARLLLTKQADMYISMILTAYKLEPNYINLLVNSFNPDVNLR